MSSADDHLAVADAIGSLPPDLRAELAKGPLPDGQCRICATLNYLALGNEVAETILDYHEVSYEQVVEAMHHALGRDRRITPTELAYAEAAASTLGAVPASNVKTLGMARNAIQCMGDNLIWMRCLYVYQVAGWKP
jgi:hypothetical protein